MSHQVISLLFLSVHFKKNVQHVSITLHYPERDMFMFLLFCCKLKSDKTTCLASRQTNIALKRFSTVSKLRQNVKKKTKYKIINRINIPVLYFYGNSTLSPSGLNPITSHGFVRVCLLSCFCSFLSGFLV